MATRYRKSVKIAPGVKLNVGKKSVGLSVGTRGAHISANSSGRVTKTVGIPGSGLSYTTSKTMGSQGERNTDCGLEKKQSLANKLLPFALGFLAVSLVLYFAAHG